MTVVKCPTCKKNVLWSSTPSRPFCSEGCKLIDLGAWADGSYAIPLEPIPDDIYGSSNTPEDDRDS